MQVIARNAIKSELTLFEDLPKRIREGSCEVSGPDYDGDRESTELYQVIVPQEDPADTIIWAQARVNRFTGECTAELLSQPWLKKKL